MQSDVLGASKTGSWSRFRRTVYALFIRQLQQRLAGSWTGLVWIVLDPLVIIVFTTLMHTIIRGRSSSSYDIIIFVGSGIIPFFMFRKMVQTSLIVFKRNQSLYHYGQIKPFDTFLANVFLESSIYLIVAILLMLLAAVLGMEILPKDPLIVILAALWLAIFAISWGLFLGVWSFFYEIVAKIFGFLSFPLLLLSSVFYPLSIVPPVAREWLLYNPVVHFMELIHGSYLKHLDTRYVDYNYMFMWTIVPLFFGLLLYKKSEWKYIKNDLVT